MARAQLQYTTLRQDAQHLVLAGSPTGKVIGRGVHGSVEEVNVDGLICVGKRYDEKLLEQIPIGELATKFITECDILCKLRHPNIVQFLGLCFNHSQQPPLLISEKVEGCLQGLFESVPNISITLKRSLLEDTARGLHYLHAFTDPIIIHGDLTAHNVLYTSSLVAKIADVSNYRLFDIHNQSGESQPGTDDLRLYMPPEIGHRSTHKTDVFAFGHLALCVLTQVFPKSLPDPTLSSNKSEVKRREEYFQKAEREPYATGDGSLLPMIKKCLNDDPKRRPTSEELLHTLQGIKAKIEGHCTDFAKANEVRQVLTAKDFGIMEQKLKKSEEAHKQTLEELECKDRVIQEIGAKLKQKDTEACQEVNVSSNGKEMYDGKVTVEHITGSCSKSSGMELKIMCGYYATPRREPTAEGCTHDWTAFVNGEGGQKDTRIKHVIKKVVFKLHESYQPNDKRVVDQPPFEVSVSGYGTFELPIRIHFTNKEVATLKFPIHIYKDCEVSQVLSKAFRFQRPSAEFREKLVLAGASPCDSKSTSSSTKGKGKKRSLSKKSSQPKNKKMKTRRSSTAKGKKEDEASLSTSDLSDNDWTFSQEPDTSDSN